MEGAADVAETVYTPFASEPDAVPVRLMVRRVTSTPSSQLALLAKYGYHAFITDCEGDTLDLEADHHRHTEIENAIRDLNYGVGLNHLPSGCFAANAAWLTVQVIAHNPARWTTRLGMGEPVATTKIFRRRFFSLTGRITRKARRIILHLAQGLALAEPVQQCRGPIARPANLFPTSPSAFDLATMTLHAWPMTAQIEPLMISPGRFALKIAPDAVPRNGIIRLARRAHPASSIPTGTRPGKPFSWPYIRRLTGKAASPRWIRV